MRPIPHTSTYNLKSRLLRHFIITRLTHISRYVARCTANSHTSIYKKVKVVIGNSGCINELYLQWVPYIPGTTATVCFRCMETDASRKAYPGGGTYVCPIWQ